MDNEMNNKEFENGSIENNNGSSAQEQTTVKLKKENVPSDAYMPPPGNIPPVPPFPPQYGNAAPDDNPYSRVAPSYFNDHNDNQYGYNAAGANYGATNTPPPPYGAPGQVPPPPPYGVPGQVPPPSYAQYPNNQYIYNNRVNQQNNKDVPGLILGIISIVTSGAPLVGAIVGAVGMGVSSGAKKRAASEGLPQSTNSKAGFICSLIGLILNILVTAIFILAIVLAVLFGDDSTSSKKHYYDYDDDYGYHYYYDDDDFNKYYNKYFT